MSPPHASTPSFTARSEHELHAMDDAALLAHVAAAKRANRRDQAELAMWMLLYKHDGRMRHRVRLRIPRHLSHHAATVEDWVVERVWRSALRLGLKGESPGEWVSWWGTAVDRQVVSFWRTALGKSLEAQVDGDERAADEFDVERLLAQACYSEIVEAVLRTMENPMHVAVVRAAFWEDRPSADIAAEHGTSAANVDQIKSRFRGDLRAECERRGVTEP